MEKRQDDAVDDLTETALLGLRAEEFIRSPIGAYLVKRAEEERSALLEEFVTANPHAHEHIRLIQHRIGVLDCWQQWVADAIQDGDRARGELVDMGQ